MDLRETPGGAFRRHPWEVARARFFRRAIRRTGIADRPLTILDVGAGDGYFARELLRTLPAGSRIACWDEAYRDRGAPSHEAGIWFSPARPDGRFDLALLLDVLEHVEDDLDFLRGIVEGSLTPGAHVLVSVPAWPRLTTSHDCALGHFRRYTPAAARGLLAGGHLDIIEEGGLFHSLLALRAAQKVLERVRPRPRSAGELAWTKGEASARAADIALSLDNAVSGGAARIGLSLPGLSWWARCHRS